ncbi:DUF2179 domain-containing protein [Roseburia sp. AM59-24XD]|nr:DUF2179 domain-containing protein [Roseburia sp. AM59-24XD]
MALLLEYPLFLHLIEICNNLLTALKYFRILRDLLHAVCIVQRQHWICILMIVKQIDHNAFVTISDVQRTHLCQLQKLIDLCQCHCHSYSKINQHIPFR